MSEPLYTVHALPAWDAITTSDRCRHAGPNMMLTGLPIGSDESAVCMACGTVVCGGLTIWEALARLWDEWGFHAHVGGRIRDLVQALALREMAAAGVRYRRTKRQRHMLVSIGPAGLFVILLPAERVIFELPVRSAS